MRYDTETNSLNELEADLIGVSLAIKPGEACYVPLGHIEQDFTESISSETKRLKPGQIDRNEALHVLKPILETNSILK